MAATSDSRTVMPAPASEIADRIRTAAFVQLVPRADGAALAAAGVLAHACAARDTPFHVRTVRTRAGLADRMPETDDTARIPLGIGPDGAAAPSCLAVDVARALEVEPDPVLALAGIRAAGGRPHDVAPRLLDAAGLERAAGIAAPTRDPTDAAAHTTYASTPVSGRPDAARDFLGEHGITGESAGDHRALASALALKTVEDPGLTERAGEMIEAALRPYAIDGPFATLAGYGDVLRALARRAPGLGVSLALGEAATDPALAVWREWAAATHTGVRSAELTSDEGCCVADTMGPVESVARLLRDFRATEPVVLAVNDGTAGVAARDRDIQDRLASAAAAVEGAALARGSRGYAEFEPGRAAAFVDAFREAS